MPEPQFARRLCEGYYPDVALALLASGTPFTRAYLRGEVVAWNASGGASKESKLSFDEEVLLVRHRKAAPGGMSVSGAGDGFDVLRWDGSCVSLDEGEVTIVKPPRAKHAKVEWKDLDRTTQDALLADPAILQAYKAQARECKGVTMGAVSKACIKAHNALSDTILACMRRACVRVEPSTIP